MFTLHKSKCRNCLASKKGIMAEEQEGATTEQIAEAPQSAETQENSNSENIRVLREGYERSKDLQREVEFLRMQMMQQQQQKQQTQEEDVSIDKFRDDDIPTYGELKKILKNSSVKEQKLLEKMKALEMRTQYSDYNEVVNTYLADVLEQDPDLAVAIQNNPYMHKLAYKLAQASPKYHEQRMSKQNQNVINKIVENQSRPQPANARKNVTVQNEETSLKNMSDADIMAMFNMAKARS